MIAVIRKIDDIIARVEKSLVIFLFSLLILSIFFNIISRDFFQRSFHNLTEISPALVLWLALMGASLCLKDGGHIKIEIALRFFSDRWVAAANVTVSLFGMAVTGILAVAACQFVSGETAIFGVKGLSAIIFPCFFSLSFFRFFLQLFGLSPNSKAPSEYRS
jgi:TRAP-type C4-dicarboxylate transport system permease small subunit